MLVAGLVLNVIFVCRVSAAISEIRGPRPPISSQGFLSLVRAIHTSFVPRNPFDLTFSVQLLTYQICKLKLNK